VIDPELQLDNTDRNHLIALLESQGWPILKNIMEAECNKFNVALLNCAPGKTEEVLARHALAKAAAQVVTAIIARLNSELEIYRHAGDSDIAPDITEDVLDLGEDVMEELG
jgi:hypothetical protein